MLELPEVSVLHTKLQEPKNSQLISPFSMPPLMSFTLVNSLFRSSMLVSQRTAAGRIVSSSAWGLHPRHHADPSASATPLGRS